MICPQCNNRLYVTSTATKNNTTYRKYICKNEDCNYNCITEETILSNERKKNNAINILNARPDEYKKKKKRLLENKENKKGE